jgi:flavodoxin
MKRCLAFFALATILTMTSVGSLFAQSVATPSKTNPSPFGHSLIIYFSQTGNTEKVAQLIQDQIQGELFRLELESPLPQATKDLIEILKPFRETGTKMAVKTPVPDIAGYDTIFVGGPVWFGQPAFPLVDFLKKMDFKGKKVIVFGTNGSKAGAALDKLIKLCQNAQIVAGSRFFDKDAQAKTPPQAIIIDWLASLKP